MSNTLTAEDWEAWMKDMLKRTSHAPNILLLHPLARKRVDYIGATKVVWELLGARRKVGPDGKTWIEKKWRTAKVSRGGGHKVKRRMGLVPHFCFDGEIEWR